ncbi:hypothetical protein CEXT_248211 [Caerostris extrusa]|uniref:Uncharacterized protein n=1 Tax=Caerostris extrusa TaxID=172846 RepID=A0AAV4XV53_CAEEX|nr:hypothetical protein CEXT_248211 [Caerostris extrusa]
MLTHELDNSEDANHTTEGRDGISPSLESPTTQDLLKIASEESTHGKKKKKKGREHCSVECFRDLCGKQNAVDSSRVECEWKTGCCSSAPRGGRGSARNSKLPIRFTRKRRIRRKLKHWITAQAFSSDIGARSFHLQNGVVFSNAGRFDLTLFSCYSSFSVVREKLNLPRSGFSILRRHRMILVPREKIFF